MNTYCSHNFLPKDANWQSCTHCGLLRPLGTVGAYGSCAKHPHQNLVNCPDCAAENTVIVLPTPSEGAVERKEEGRNTDTKYTYYQVDLENINEEWDYTICETLEEVYQILTAMDIHLDDDSPTATGEQIRVVVTGVGMTPKEYKEWKADNDMD